MRTFAGPSRSLRATIALAPLLFACGGGSAGNGVPRDGGVVIPDAGLRYLGTEVPAETQRAGDPDAGYSALVNNGYVSCGIPYRLYQQYLGGQTPDDQKLPGRTGHNRDLPYFFTAYTTARGVEVVSTNCLTCHAETLNGKLIVGLGSSTQDFTQDPSRVAEAAGFLINDANERAEWRKWADRVSATAPYIQTKTVGANPADNLAAALFAHRDPVTLEWSNEPLLEPPPTHVVPVDVPPWWRMKKKTSMFYSAQGRGDHARIMMTASTLCTDSVAEADVIDAYFNDVRAFIASLEPPAYPYPIDQTLAARGKALFDANCATCHGTYGAGGHYPNRLIPVEDVGTDATLATGGAQFAERFVDWFRRSYYGRTARFEPQAGYLAPPLDGIWATAPYLHNGSVPTLAALLDEESRPRFWTRTFDTSDYDETNVGWSYEVLDHGQDDEPNASARTRIYDTTILGYSNEGHGFGGALQPDERSAVLEYLKTL